MNENLYVDASMESLLIKIAENLRFGQDENPEIAKRVALNSIKMIERYNSIKEVEKYDKHMKELMIWAKKIIENCNCASLGKDKVI